jgi:hypothetical protein
MSWFRTRPRLRQEEKKYPRHAVNEGLRHEIEQNQRRTQEHRQSFDEEKTHGKFHRR